MSVSDRVLDALALIHSGANTFKHTTDEETNTHHLAVDRLPPKLDGERLAKFAAYCGEIRKMELRASDKYADRMKMLLYFCPEENVQPDPPEHQNVTSTSQSMSKSRARGERKLDIDFSGMSLTEVELPYVRNFIEAFVRELGDDQRALSYDIRRDEELHVIMHDLDFVDYIKFIHVLLKFEFFKSYSIQLDNSPDDEVRRLSVEIVLAVPKVGYKRRVTECKLVENVDVQPAKVQKINVEPVD